MRNLVTVPAPNADDLHDAAAEVYPFRMFDTEHPSGGWTKAKRREYLDAWNRTPTEDAEAYDAANRHFLGVWEERIRDAWRREDRRV